MELFVGLIVFVVLIVLAWFIPLDDDDDDWPDGQRIADETTRGSLCDL